MTLLIWLAWLVNFGFGILFLWFFLSPHLIERLRRWRGDGGSVLKTTADDGWHPVATAPYVAVTSQPPPRHWSLLDQIKADMPTTWWAYGWILTSAVYVPFTGRWSLLIFVGVVTYLIVAGTLTLIRVRRHGPTAIVTVDSIRGPRLMTYGVAVVNLARATIGKRGDGKNRILVPWRACRLLLDRHGSVELLVLLDRHGRPVNTLAMRPAKAAGEVVVESSASGP